MRILFLLLIFSLLNSCSLWQRTPALMLEEEIKILAENHNPSLMSYRSPIRDGYSLSSCKLTKKLDELAIVFEFENDQSEVWSPPSYVLESVESNMVKTTKNGFRNLHKIEDVSGVYEFDFSNPEDPSSIHRFSSIKNAGWGKVSLNDSLQSKKAIQAQCLFY
jgi:hypothetical protein